jgi:hypothetical protein
MLDQNIDRFLGMEQSFAGGDWFESSVCGIDVWQQLPQNPKCESTGLALKTEPLREAIQKEFDQLTELKVGAGLGETQLNLVSKQLGVRIIPCRWVLTLKGDGRTRARLVCKDFKHLGQSALKEGHYSPTSTIESLRAVLAVAEINIRPKCGEQWAIISLDVSNAFMYASLRRGERILVSLPGSTRSRKDNRKVGLDLFKALNGLRRAPLLWYLEIRGTLVEIGWNETADPAVFRKVDKWGRLQLMLLYVDDTIMVGPLDACMEVVNALGARYTIKETGRIQGTQKGQLEFLGRLITRDWNGGHLGWELLTPTTMKSRGLQGLSLTLTSKVPDLTRFVEEEKDQVLLERSKAQVYRTVLGKMSWLAISLPTILYCTSWLSCYQSKPTERAWAALIAVLKFLKSQRGFRQSFPCGNCDLGSFDDWKVTGTVDASWSLRSVMGGYLHWKGCFLKGWSRRIPVPCLSSAEAELFTLVEGLKEAVGMSMLLESMLQGLPPKDDYVFLSNHGRKFPDSSTDGQSGCEANQHDAWIIAACTSFGVPGCSASTLHAVWKT